MAHRINLEGMAELQSGTTNVLWCSGAAKDGRQKRIDMVIYFSTMGMPNVGFFVRHLNAAGDYVTLRSFFGAGLLEVIEFYNEV